METVLKVIELLVAMGLIIVVLLQRSEGGALGIGGSGGGLGGLFSPRGAANTLTRMTAILGILFFTTTLALTILALNKKPSTSILDQAPAGTSSTGTSNPAKSTTGGTAPPTLPSKTSNSTGTAPPTLPSTNTPNTANGAGTGTGNGATPPTSPSNSQGTPTTPATPAVPRAN
jgi:preprotein translocase subunit SecG